MVKYLLSVILLLATIIQANASNNKQLAKSSQQAFFGSCTSWFHIHTLWCKKPEEKPVAPDCLVSGVEVTNVVYSSGTTSSPDLQKVAKSGQNVKVTFTVPASAEKTTFSLVSYKAPDKIFTEEDANMQIVYDFKTIQVSEKGGTFTIEIKLPDCFLQVDFVKGCIIEKLGPEGTDNYYGKQGRLLGYANGGDQVCVPVTDPEGCTPTFWKNNTKSWEGYTTTASFFSAFGIDPKVNRGLDVNVTLLKSLSLSGTDFANLARHATAGLLSASNSQIKYSYTEGQVKKMVQDAFYSGKAEAVKNLLADANDKVCSLDKPDNPCEDTPSKLSAYPSPFCDRTTINFTLGRSDYYSLSVYNAYGAFLGTLKSGYAYAGQQNKAELSGYYLKEGFYYVRLTTNRETVTIKVLLDR